MTEAHVRYIVDTSTPKALSVQDVREATEEDTTIQAATKALETGAWCKDSLLYRVRHELSMVDGVMLKERKIVIPSKLHNQFIQLAHEGHQGIEKTKALARETTWFPGIDKKIENLVKDCLACQVTTPITAREPLQMSELPPGSREELSMDFGQISPSEYLMVVTDEYSRYPVVDVIHSTSADIVIPILDKTLSEFGVPEVMKSDKGPPFNSKEFAAYAKSMGLSTGRSHHFGQEQMQRQRFMRTVKKCIKAAKVEKKSWRQEEQRFLRSYRSTPHTTTGKTPYEALFKREMKTKLPQLAVKPVNDDVEMRERDKAEKLKMKGYADHANAKPSKIMIGDSVVVKDTSLKKSNSAYHPEPMEVVEKKGSMMTAENGRRSVTRNSSFFKQVNA